MITMALRCVFGDAPQIHTAGPLEPEYGFSAMRSTLTA